MSLSDTNEQGDTPLHAAVTRSSTLIIQHLLDRGADKKAVNKKGLTPVAVARASQAFVRHKDLSRLLRCWRFLEKQPRRRTP